MIYVDKGTRVTHMMQGNGGAPHRLSACDSHYFHGRLPDEIQQAMSTEAVTCQRCRRTAVFVVARREEEAR